VGEPESGLVEVPVAGDHVAVGEDFPDQILDEFSCHTTRETYANSMTEFVVVSTMPFTATWPPNVIVQTFPDTSTIDPPDADVTIV
jgi:hypothetical protein